MPRRRARSCARDTLYVLLSRSLSLLLLLLLAAPAVARAADPVTGDPVIAAVGDMACDAEDPGFAGGAGTASRCAEERVSTAMLGDSSIDAVIGLGDYQYDCGDPADYAVSYAPTWGRFDALMAPVPGNHEYKTGTDVFGGTCPATNARAASYFDYFGAASHPETAGHFSFDIGTWHMVGLNGNCGKQGVGGCGAQGPQATWLRADLAATAQPCVAAFWHQPRWSAGGSTNLTAYGPWWQELYAAHADLVLNGHSHGYQRYDALSPTGAADPAGVREIVAGTGGEKLLGRFSATAKPQPQARARTFGYLRLVLHPAGYDWFFVRASDGVVLDRGAADCH